MTVARSGVPLLILGTLVLLAVGVTVPMVTTDRLVGETRTYSVLSGIGSLFRTGETGLAVLVLCFSIVFPVAKLVTLGAVWLSRPGERLERRTLSVLKVLGKWSMLDFFVVALLASGLELGIIASTEAREGAFVFGAAVVLSMLVTYLTTVLLRRAGRGGKPAWPGAVPLSFAVLVPLTAVIFWRAVQVPLMKLETWFFWEKQVSILAGALELWNGESPVLGGALLLFVVALPAVVLAGWAALWIVSRFVRPLPATVARGFLALEEWAMADVFALAVFVVAAKISGVVGFEPRTGLWLLGASGVLFVALSALGRRSLRLEA